MSKPVYLWMPQWQGSPSSRAMQLIDGAHALSEDLPSRARHDIAVPDKAGDALGTPVARLSSVLAARDAALEVLGSVAEPAITLGGDTATSLAGLDAAVRAHGDELAVLWCDSDAGLEHPSTSATGAAACMTLRHALGDGVADLTFPHPISPAAATLVGARDLDADELAEIERRGLATIDVGPDGVDGPDALAERVRERLMETGASHLYVHVGLGILDPAEFSSVHSQLPFGVTVAELTAAIRAAVGTLPLSGADITEFAPSSESAAAEDLPTVLRILAALTSGAA